MSVCSAGDVNKDLNSQKKGRCEQRHPHSITAVSEKDKHDAVTLAYSVKSIPLDFPPLGAIKGGDA